MPDESLDIEFSVGGLHDVLKGLKAVQDGAARTGKAFSESVGGGMKAGGNGPRYTGGPNQRLAQLRSEFVSALKDGNTLAEKDIRISIDRTEKQLKRLERPALGKKFETLIRSTRFGAGGVMPLVGQSLDMAGSMGLGEVAGPLGIVATAAFTAGRELKRFADEASQSTLDFNRQKLTTGGTAGESGILKTLGSPLGFDLNAAAKSLRERTTLGSGDPLAIAAAQSMGIDIRPERLGGTTDAATGQIAFLDRLRKIKSDSEAKRLADIMGQPEALGVRSMSAADYNSLKQSGAITGEAQGGPGAIRSAAAYAAAQARLNDTITRAKVGPGNWASNTFTRALNYGNGVLTGQRPVLPAWSDTLSNPPSTMQREGDAPAFASATPRARRAMQRYEASHTAALQANTQALQAHAQVMAKHAAAVTGKGIQLPAVYGTFGNETRGDAIPSNLPGLHWGALRNAQKRRASENFSRIQLSAF